METTPTADEHYLRHLTETGEQRDLITSEPVLARNGLKLLAAGVRVDRSVADKLLRHKLLRPLDSSVTARDALTVAEIVARAEQVRESDEPVGLMLKQLPDANAPMRALSALVLIPPLALKLTVAAERQPRVIEHGLSVAMLAAAIGAELDLPTSEVQALAVAGLFHDIGELHLNPELFSNLRPLGEEEQRQIESHPIIAYLLLERFHEYHPHVSIPVLQHHERRDGRGYPHGLDRVRITRTGNVLALAELAAGMCAKGGCGDLIATLRLCGAQFDAQAVRTLHGLAAAASNATSAHAGSEPVALGGPTAAETGLSTEERWHTLAATVGHLESIVSELEGSDARVEVALQLRRRLGGLNQVSARLGLELGASAVIPSFLLNDSQAMLELKAVARELEYQLKEVAWDVRRRARNTDTVVPLNLMEWCDQVSTADTLIS